MSFRSVLTRSTAALAAVILVGCSSGTSSPSAATGSSVAGGAGTTLTFAAVQGVEDTGIKALAPIYEQQTGVKIKVVEFPYNDLYTKLLSTFQSNDSTFDLFMSDDPWMPKWGTMGALADLGSFGIQRDPDIASSIWDLGTWPPPSGPVPPSENGKPAKLVGVTVVANTELFMYRSDLTPTGPKTWDEVLANAKAQNKDGVAGYYIRGKAYDPAATDFLPILWSFGGDLFDAQWNVTYDSPETVAAIKYWSSDLKAVAQADPVNADAGDRDLAMAKGTVYQSTVWPGEVSSILDPSVSKVVGKVGFSAIPVGPSGKGVGLMGNWLMGIPNASKQQTAAAAFVRWMLQKDTQMTYAQNGGIPSRSSVLSDPSLTAANPYFPTLAAALEAGPRWIPRTDQWNAIESVFGTDLNAVLAGQMTPEQAATHTASELRTLLQGAGYPTK